MKCHLQRLSFRSRVESAQSSEKLIGSGGRQKKQAIELFGPLFSQPLNRKSTTNFTGKAVMINEKGCEALIQDLAHGVKCHFLVFGSGKSEAVALGWELLARGSWGQTPAHGEGTAKVTSWQRPRCKYVTFTRWELCLSQLLWLPATQPGGVILKECFAVRIPPPNAQLTAWFGSQPCHLFVVWLWASHFLSLFLCKMEICLLKSGGRKWRLKAEQHAQWSLTSAGG